MSLVTRLVSPDRQSGEIKLPVHQFTAAIAEYKRGELLGSELVSKFGLAGDEITTLQQWQTIIDASGETASSWRGILEDIFILGESGYYEMIDVENRLIDLGLTY